MALAINDLNVPQRLLLGPGPSAVHPRVLRTMSTALVGYLDPEWLSLMDEEQALLRAVFQTKKYHDLSHVGNWQRRNGNRLLQFRRTRRYGRHRLQRLFQRADVRNGEALRRQCETD